MNVQIFCTAPQVLQNISYPPFQLTVIVYNSLLKSECPTGKNGKILSPHSDEWQYLGAPKNLHPNTIFWMVP